MDSKVLVGNFEPSITHIEIAKRTVNRWTKYINENTLYEGYDEKTLMVLVKEIAKTICSMTTTPKE